MHFLVFFSFSSLSSASAIVEIDELPGAGLAALQQRSHLQLGSRSAGDACRLSWVRQCCTYKQKPEWGKKRKLKLLKKKIERQEKETAHPRGSLASLALWRRDRRSPWWSWELCDFDVTSSCDVISPDHFVRGFYNSSFRRCRPNFLVLQKEYKILVHNLSIYENLEQSTHWIIQKKWGKDFTFGSDCTVSQKRHDGFSLLNDGNLDKCLSKKQIRLATPALWLSGPHWAKCMTNSYPRRSPSKRHAKSLHSNVGAPSRGVYLDLGISQIGKRRKFEIPEKPEISKLEQIRQHLYDIHEKLYKRYGRTAKPAEEATNARLASVSIVE